MTDIILTTKQRNKIKRALKALEEVRVEVQMQTVDDVNWYVEDSENLCLMDGETHTGIHGGFNDDNVIEVFTFTCASGGGM